jgi:hypothetical protein
MEQKNLNIDRFTDKEKVKVELNFRDLFRRVKGLEDAPDGGGGELPYTSYNAIITAGGYVEGTSGLLIVGKTYYIDFLEVGDDFANVGYVSAGTAFVATGTTPTNWTNGTYVLNLTDSTFDLVELSNNTGEIITAAVTYNEGQFINTTGSIFLEDKTQIFITIMGVSNNTGTAAYRNDNDSILFRSLVAGVKYSLEVRVYP